jgi:hypothetical protein
MCKIYSVMVYLTIWKTASEKELLLVRMGVRKITFFIKGA